MFIDNVAGKRRIFKYIDMFWKKSPTDKLKKQYEKLMKEAFDLSKVDRKKADEKTAEADAVMKELEKLLNK